jgi:hypothetical protein
VFAFPVASLDEPKPRLALEDLDHLMFVNVVFSKELIENLLDPDEADNSHARDSRRSAPSELTGTIPRLCGEKTSNYFAKREIHGLFPERVWQFDPEMLFKSASCRSEADVVHLL